MRRESTASGTAAGKTAWELRKGLHSSLATQAVVAEVVVEEKLVGGVELLTVSGGRRSLTPRLLSYISL